ncbi:hypothetical protein vseg_019849 [Gypsophila vaccaria]
MYTTRPLSMFKNTPDALSQPPSGPNSGYLVIQDDESTPTCCFGLCKNPAIKELPFPQNKLITVEYHVQSGDSSYHSYDDVYLIPVINQPLSSNLYYAIKADGKHKGETYTSSKEDDKVTCCFCIPCIKDVKPSPFDVNDIYQQFEFGVTKTWCNTTALSAKSVASDGHPPNFLRRKGWQMKGKTPRNFTMEEALGVDSASRARLPEFNNFSLSLQGSNPVVVAKWYCPFVFVKEGTQKEQVKNFVFYEMTLEQRWERVFNVDNKDRYSQEKAVIVDVLVRTKVVRVEGQGQPCEETYGNDDGGEMVWFKSRDGEVGLSTLIVERMGWEEEKVEWAKGEENEKEVRVVKEEVYGGVIGWKSFGCYILVESFVLKRNGGSVVITCDFMHTHQVRSKWE